MNIVVCGGGTAGWLSAYLIANAQKNQHKITVVESSELGIIGAGEGSTGLLYLVLADIIVKGGSSVEKFYNETDSTFKFGIKHQDWSPTPGHYFAPLDGSVTRDLVPDSFLDHLISTSPADKAHLSSLIGLGYNSNKMPSRDYGFHFDGHKVGKYFKNLLIDNNKGVEHIDAVINNVNLNERGEIKSLTLSTGQTLEGDFFIDCTGFARVLQKAMGVNWKSYKKHLPVDRAIPFIEPYKFDGTESIEQLTTSQALSSGWMWKIPLKTRMGQGYVYSSEFISDDDALKEVEKVMGHSVTPIKTIKFDSGRSESLWYKNCLSTGLAGSFLEPLEATSIHMTMIQVLEFAYQFLLVDRTRTLNPVAMKLYNDKMNNMFEDYVNFINLHYQGGRTDSEFWKFISTGETRTEFVSDVMALCKTHMPSTLLYQNYLGSSSALWNWILSGLGFLDPAIAKDDLARFNQVESASVDFQRHFDYPPFFNIAEVPPFSFTPTNT